MSASDSSAAALPRTKLLYTGADDDKVLKNVYKLTATLLSDKPIYLQHRNNASLLGSRSYFDKAIAEYQKAIDTYEPDDTLFLPETCHERALLHARRGDVSESITWFTRAIDEIRKIKSDAAWNAEMNYTRSFALLYRTAGRSHFSHAIQLYQHLITCYTTEPHIDMTQAADASYSCAEIYNEMRRWRDARPYGLDCVKWRESVLSSCPSDADAETKHRIKGDLCLAKCLLAAILGAPENSQHDQAEKYALEALDMMKQEKLPFTQQSKSDEIDGVQDILRNIKAGKQRATQQQKLLANKSIANDVTTKCCVCGLPSTSQCSRCKAVHYCSKEHQKLDWKTHKKTCVAPEEVQPRADAAVRNITATSTTSETAITTSTAASTSPT